MWQTICICLPAVTKSEQQRFFSFFSEAYKRKPGEMDISLFFLHSLSKEETLTVLEERLDLVLRSQELMEWQTANLQEVNTIQAVVSDHMRTLIAAEHAWLQRTIAFLRASKDMPADIQTQAS